jgi:nitroreductase
MAEKSCLETIYSRRSVRNFTGGNISQELIDELVKAAMAAPTAVNMQPWEFVIIRDRAMMDRLGDGLPFAKMIYKAGAAVVVCTTPEKANDKMQEYAIIDACCATMNMLLAAESLGLGAVWTAAYPRNDRMVYVRKCLNIPDNVIPLNVIPIGIPLGTDQPKNKYKPERIHREKWQRV